MKVGAGDCLVKSGTGNREITCYDRYYHVHIDFHHHVCIKSLISPRARCVESRAWGSALRFHLQLIAQVVGIKHSIMG